MIIILFYDFEVFKHNWLVVLIDVDKQQETVIIDNSEKMKKFFEENKNEIWVGFNNVHYDQYILKAILCDLNPKEVSDFIIKKEQAGWKFSNLFNQIQTIQYDVMLRTDRGLKTFEGFLGNNIKETDVDFDIDRPLTKEEIEQTVFYCRHDVENTIEVFIRRISEFNTMMFFINHFKYPITDLSKTKPQLAAKILGGNYAYERNHWNDEFDFPLVDCLRLKKYKYIADWYKKPENKTYSKSQDVMVAGVPHTYSWGGGHGAIPSYHDTGVFMIIDVTAYYPSLQEEYKFGYRVMGNPENFEFIHGSNIKFKRAGDKKARQPFKIMDNAISGQMKQKSSALYDPMSNNSICVNGQMLLLDLVEHLEPVADLIQNNTDGIVFKVRDYEKDFDTIDDIVWEWEQRTGMRMDFDTFFGEIYQKDVNNYMLLDHETGAMKVKGGYIKKLSELDYDLPILNKALVDYMVKGVPVEKTIFECDDLKEFQQVKKISGKYDHIKHGDRIVNEKCVRVFASTNQSDGGLVKKHKTTGKYAKLEGTPEHCFIYNDSVEGVKVPQKLNKQWYIDEAKKRLKGFGV